MAQKGLPQNAEKSSGILGIASPGILSHSVLSPPPAKAEQGNA